VSIITPLNNRRGSLWVSHDMIYFYDELSSIGENPKSPTEMFDFFNFKKSPYQSLRKHYHLSKITVMFKRRYLLSRRSLEIYFSSNHSLTLEFQNEKELASFVKLIKERNKTVKYTDDIAGCMKKHKVVEKWRNNQITTFEMLMWINFIAGRSYNDLS